ncbi:unnamed protein product [Rodentolepis nana]|uniref:Uncharacterized protein n=1 Tax=Rodentolepis nana TaxID=102285 RepID=A0A3P7SYH4_RODNA|nr:unnamed protein product [Rodentolepis nana]
MGDNERLGKEPLVQVLVRIQPTSANKFDIEGVETVKVLVGSTAVRKEGEGVKEDEGEEEEEGVEEEEEDGERGGEGKEVEEEEDAQEEEKHEGREKRNESGGQRRNQELDEEEEEEGGGVELGGSAVEEEKKIELEGTRIQMDTATEMSSDKIKATKRWQNLWGRHCSGLGPEVHQQYWRELLTRLLMVRKGGESCGGGEKPAEAMFKSTEFHSTMGPWAQWIYIAEVNPQVSQHTRRSHGYCPSDLNMVAW